MHDRYPRDMRGYGQSPPHPHWPGDARIAVQFVVNYEEGGELSPLHGDGVSETFLTEVSGKSPVPAIRDVSVESVYEYGSRAGFWRLHRLLTGHQVPVTVFGVAMALGRNPDAVAAMREAHWEIASHGYRWIDYQTMSEAVERHHLQRAIELHRQITGERPLGWYCGRTSPNTRRLVVEEGGFVYDADSYADDLPYWVYDHGRPQLIVPYTLDTNDMRFATVPGFGTGQDFFSQLRDAFDVLYAEGETAPKMMSVGLHCRLAGRPGRAAALQRFLDYLRTKERVWLCRRIDVATHWRAVHPADPARQRTGTA